MGILRVCQPGLFALIFTVAALFGADVDWPVYGHDAAGTKYSPLDQITRANVSKLRVAWTYHSRDLYNPKNGRKSQFESTPIYVDGTLYLSTAFGRVIALDPKTGTERWTFDPKVDITAGFGDFVNRGVSTWVDSKTKSRLIFIATIDARLIALDAATGLPVKGFGDNGQIDLKTGLRLPVKEKSEYEETSPPAIIGDVVVVGSGIADNGRADMASGEVRAYDARTGRKRWTFDPMPGTRTGAANAWSVISVDVARKLVFLPTGSASPDYYGGERKGNNQYANSVVALRAETGEVVWSFQTVHHDLWDYDVASQPVLFDTRRDGKNVPAIAVGSKTGNLFILNRETGKPIFGVEERAVPKSDVPGEEASPTQPFPVLPLPLAPQSLRPEDAWGMTDEDRKWCADRIRANRSEGVFTPPAIDGTVAFPGNVGGMAWGGASFDLKRGLLIVPTNRLPFLIRLIPREKFAAARRAESANGDVRVGTEFAEQAGTPYGMARTAFLSPHGTPCNPPPWGALTAIDVNSGAKKWEVPLGSLPWLKDVPDAAKWGSISLGGPITTAGGLVFIGATLDPHLHAFDVETGKLLWDGEMPAGARSTPMTFQASGKQFVVIAAGGHDIPGVPQSDALVAFSLPD